MVPRVPPPHRVARGVRKKESGKEKQNEGDPRRGESAPLKKVKKSAGRVLKFRRFNKCRRIKFIAQVKILSLVDSYQLSVRRSRSGRGLIKSVDNLYVIIVYV